MFEKARLKSEIEGLKTACSELEAENKELRTRLEHINGLLFHERRQNNTLKMQLQTAKTEAERLEAVLFEVGASKAVKEARIAKIRRLFSQGKNVTDISRDLFGYTGGYAYHLINRAVKDSTTLGVNGDA